MTLSGSYTVHRMRLGRFFWKLFLGNAVLLSITLGICIWLIVAEFDRFQANQLAPYLHNYAATIVTLVEDRLPDEKFPIESLVTRVAATHPEAVRITVLAPNGEVLADSQGDAMKMENHLERPEVQQALTTGRGESERWSETVSRTMKYVALRVDRDGQNVGVVRVAMPVRTIAERTEAARRVLGPIGVMALLAALGLAVGLALLWSNRIRRITAAANALSRGDLTTTIPAHGSDEVSMLARSLERMRMRLMNQMAAVINQQHIYESLLNSLTEGVLVSDSSGRIIFANAAAGRLLSCDTFPSTGLMSNSGLRVEECVVHHDLQQMLLGVGNVGDSESGTAGTAHKPEGDDESDYLPAIRLEIRGAQTPAHVLARVLPIEIPATSGGGRVPPSPIHATGRLLILTEITEVVRAIRARSDFVANASHELRTPVAAIRVAAETIIKMDLAHEADAAIRFVGVISRQASRLEALVSDLLELARVESPGARFEPSVLQLQRVVDELRSRWDEEFSKKELQWHADVRADASRVTANLHLLSVVLDNLVDNAIKFTPPGGSISVRTEAAENRIRIEIEDTGCGIPPEDQNRVFERFYQVDAVRSGTGNDKRGTGLGLSIVRHAVSAMGGTVRLQSSVGVGTKVTVEMPAAGK